MVDLAILIQAEGKDALSSSAPPSAYQEQIVSGGVLIALRARQGVVFKSMADRSRHLTRASIITQREYLINMILMTSVSALCFFKCPKNSWKRVRTLKKDMPL